MECRRIIVFEHTTLSERRVLRLTRVLKSTWSWLYLTVVLGRLVKIHENCDCFCSFVCSAALYHFIFHQPSFVMILHLSISSVICICICIHVCTTAFSMYWLRVFTSHKPGVYYRFISYAFTSFLFCFCLCQSAKFVLCNEAYFVRHDIMRI